MLQEHAVGRAKLGDFVETATDEVMGEWGEAFLW
jgi:hypothetical protein